MLLKRMVTKTDVPADAAPVKLPLNLLSDFLNCGTVQHPRHRNGDDYKIHVSELMKVGPKNEFCPRKFVLDLVDVREIMPRRITPGQELMFETGTAYHDFARNRFIEHSKFGEYAWGVWKCKCERSSRTGVKPKLAKKCIYCKTKLKHYHEFNAVSAKHKIVGHPDFLIMWKGVIYIYEIKTLERKDIDFDTLAEPLGDHQLQGTFYYWLLRGLGYKVHPMIRYLYIDRSTSKMFKGKPFKELTAKVSPPDRLEPFIKKAEAIVEARRCNLLPMRLCDKSTCERAKACEKAAVCFGLKGNEYAYSRA